MGDPTPIGEQDGFLGWIEIAGVLDIEGKPVLVSVAQGGQANSPRLEVVASGDHVSMGTKHAVVLAFGRLLGLRIDLSALYTLASKQRRSRELASRFRGLKPHRFPTVWEGLVNGVACQ